MTDNLLADRLRKTVEKNSAVIQILNHADELKIPNWYLAAGCIAQTVWNELHGFPLAANVKDYDLIYFDDSDLSYDREDAIIGESKRLFPSIPVQTRNEARVHLWYESHFGYSIAPYKSVEDAISSFHCTATSIGVRYDKRDGFVVCAPFGLEDIFSLVVRPNKRKITKEIYMEKAQRWIKIWPKLKVIPW